MSFEIYLDENPQALDEIAIVLEASDGFGARMDLKKAREKARAWILENKETMQKKLCGDNALSDLVAENADEARVTALIASLLSDFMIFGGAPVTSISALISDYGLKRFCADFDCNCDKSE